jgi:hypothetical protein
VVRALRQHAVLRRLTTLVRKLAAATAASAAEWQVAALPTSRETPVTGADRRLRIFFQVALQPAGCDPWMAARVFSRDQKRQLERVFEAELRQLPRRGQGGDDVAALDGSLEDRMGTALRGRRCSFPRGRDGEGSLRDVRM